MLLLLGQEEAEKTNAIALLMVCPVFSVVGDRICFFLFFYLNLLYIRAGVEQLKQ